MKSKEEILARLKEVVEGVSLGSRKAASIADSDMLITGLGLDSLDYASVLLGMEQWLGIHIREEGVNWREIQSVSQLADFLRNEQGR